jgi:hypothetical protein
MQKKWGSIYGVCLAVIVAILVTVAPAQIGGSGSVQGTVSDSSGAVIPGAFVTATNVATGVQTRRQTTAVGYYVVSPLPAGQYTVTVGAAGFHTFRQENVTVDALSVVGLDVRLDVGQATETVTVTGEPTPLNVSDASMGQTMRNELYTALPLTMGARGSANNIPRDPMAFLTLLPGMSAFGGQSGGAYGGAIQGSQEVYVEGIAMTNPVLQGESRYISIGMSIEAIEQFQFETPSAGAGMYSGQGATNFVIKSGTNRFHGSAYYANRNTVLDARGFFATRRPQQNQNEFTATIGGPFVRNRLFFFGSYGGFRKRQEAGPSFFSIPTLRQRGGDFGEIPAIIYDPLTTTCAGVPCARQPFPQQRVPANRFSSVSSFLQSELPVPTHPGVQNNLLTTTRTGHNVDSTTNKIDFNLNETHQFYLLVNHGHKHMPKPQSQVALPLPYGDGRLIDEIMTTAQVRHTYVMSTNTLNQFSLGFNRFNVPLSNITIDGEWAKRAGLTGLPPGEASLAFPAISFGGPNSPAGWRTANSNAFDQVHNTFTVTDTVQWLTGKHSLTFGGQLQFLQANEKPRTYGSTASWAFSNTQTAGFGGTGTLLTATGNSYASYLLGGPNSSSLDEDSAVGVGGRVRTYAWWVQDNYKLTRRLTVNLGLRHDISTPWVEVADRMSWLNPDLPNPAIGGFRGALEFAGFGPNSCKCRNNFSPYYRALGPRIGFAYQLTSKTVIRAGYAMTYSRQGSGGGRGSGTTGTGLLGYTASPTFSSLDGGISPAYYWDRGVPPYQKAPFFDSTLNTGFTTQNPQGGSITYGNPEESNRPPRYQNWNFSIQHAITSTFVLDLAYVANNAHYVGGGPAGIWSAEIDPKYLALGNLLRSTANAANIAAARMQFPEIALPFSNFSGVLSQMLRPFPQYSGVTNRWGNRGNINYNSLQMIGRKTLSHGLILNFNYALSKGFDDLSSRSGYINDKAQSTQPTHILNAMFVYQLPFAGSVSNPVLKGLVRDWQLSGVTTYSSGGGLGSFGAACNLPNAGSCNADYNPVFSGPVRINGDYGSGDLVGARPAFLDLRAFRAPDAFTYGTTPRTLAYALRGPARYNQDLSVRRDFRLREGWRLAVDVDFVNVFNMVNFGNPNTSTTSTAFGTITSQSNLPRLIQLGARVSF